eukprot:TRINITY_DN7137_c0_g1_i1.p1 TRINITY_DN7137_c0_g1~~TRINITY_DN7137_c0_g1_i1.p1  ORF type:complete len:211 (-),score=39.48 TRINITY_DN7137_c0_g1_i1:224-781(-)
MGEKCTSCGKTVYVVEKLNILDQVWHKWCFKCAVCSTTLTMKNYQAMQGKPYCKTHYPQPGREGDLTAKAEAGNAFGDANRGAQQEATYVAPADGSGSVASDAGSGYGDTNRGANQEATYGYDDQGAAAYDQGGGEQAYAEGGDQGYAQEEYAQEGYAEGGDQGYDQGGYDQGEYYEGQEQEQGY